MKKLMLFFACTSLAFMEYVVAEEAFSRKFIESTYPNHVIEFIIERPCNQKFQTILFLHGGKNTGLDSISSSHLIHWIEKGYAVAAISMPGFGQSTGERDFCGPFTINSLNQAINQIKNELGTSRLSIIGFGQGGMAAILLAAYRDDIIGVICSNGGYDLLRHKAENDALFNGLEKKGYRLDFNSNEALMFRSPLHHISNISAPIFLLHRNGNPMVNENEVIDFHKAMLEAGKKCQLILKDKMMGDDDMKLSYEEVLLEAESWLDDLMQQE